MVPPVQYGEDQVHVTSLAQAQLGPHRRTAGHGPHVSTITRSGVPSPVQFPVTPVLPVSPPGPPHQQYSGLSVFPVRGVNPGELQFEGTEREYLNQAENKMQQERMYEECTS